MKPGPLSFLNIEQRIQHQPSLGKGPHKVPESRPPEAVLGDEAELGVHAPGVLEPNLVAGPPGVGVVEEGGPGRLVVLVGTSDRTPSSMARWLEMDWALVSP